MIKKEINLYNDPLGFINTSIGTLAIKHITFRIRAKMYEKLDMDLKDTLPSEYIKVLIKYCCVKKNDSENEKIPLIENEILKLTEEDFEKIAKYFIEKNEDLNRERKTITIEENGEKILKTEYGKINNPKKENESYQEYLLRLTIKENLEITESFKNIKETMSSFSKNLQNSIKGSLEFGKQLSESAHKIKSSNIPNLKNVKLNTENLEEFELTENSSLKTFKEFSKKLEQLIEISANSAEFMVEANKIQTRIADEVKTSSDTSTPLSKKNIKISYVVLSVTLLSFIFSIYSINEANKSNVIFVKEIITKLDTINNSLKTKESNLINRKFTEINKELDSIKKMNSFLIKEISRLEPKSKK